MKPSASIIMTKLPWEHQRKGNISCFWTYFLESTLTESMSKVTEKKLSSTYWSTVIFGKLPVPWEQIMNRTFRMTPLHAHIGTAVKTHIKSHQNQNHSQSKLYLWPKSTHSWDSTNQAVCKYLCSRELTSLTLMFWGLLKKRLYSGCRPSLLPCDALSPLETAGK